MYEVIGSAKTRAFRVLWMLEELDQDYDHLPESPGSEEARTLSPTGKLPAMKVDGETLTDSAAILTYLADKHGALTYPAGTLERAYQDGFTHLILDELDAVLWTAARHSFVLPEGRRVPEVKDSLRWEFGESLARIADRMKGDWVMGDVFTVPDILLAHCLIWARAAKFDVTQPELLTFLKRATYRPAYKRAAEAYSA
ncbi:MAG: glutathione S-transferase [Rhodobacterales bacterium]|nr:MAG: glutathione S-transferase [Rhodobacterales bacterium]